MPHPKRSSRTLGPCAFILLGAALILSACATPATLKERPGYWADQARSARAYNHRVRFLVLHYTGGNEARAFKVLTGPSVSSHYLVAPTPPSRSGEPIVYQLVAEDERAWHAGSSGWAGRSHLNDSSIGIEIVNAGPVNTSTGRVWKGFDSGQIAAVTRLARDIIDRYGIKPENVVGHSDIAPGRKIDPGPAFPWEQLHEAGVGAWPDARQVAAYRRRFNARMPSIRQIQAALAQYGYDIANTGVLDKRTRTVLISFQMHFRPARYNGQPDPGTVARLWALNDKYR